MKNVCFYKYPVGTLGIEEENGSISRVFFGDGVEKQGIVTAETPQIRKAATQLDEYFAGKRTSFDLELAPHGTEFQQSVWSALQEIPFGEVRSYKEIAEMVGSAKACRAVGMANNKNPIVIIIPCHRVIGADGSMTGYAGGLPVKEYLLKLEKNCE